MSIMSCKSCDKELKWSGNYVYKVNVNRNRHPIKKRKYYCNLICLRNYLSTQVYKPIVHTTSSANFKCFNCGKELFTDNYSYIVKVSERGSVFSVELDFCDNHCLKEKLNGTEDLEVYLVRGKRRC